MRYFQKNPGVEVQAPKVEEKEKEDVAIKAKKEAEEKVKVDTEKKVKEEADAKAKADAEKKVKEEAKNPQV